MEAGNQEVHYRIHKISLFESVLNNIKFEVFTAVKMAMLFWALTSRVLGRWRNVLFSALKMEAVISLERLIRTFTFNFNIILSFLFKSLKSYLFLRFSGKYTNFLFIVTVGPSPCYECKRLWVSVFDQHICSALCWHTGHTRRLFFRVNLLSGGVTYVFRLCLPEHVLKWRRWAMLILNVEGRKFTQICYRRHISGDKIQTHHL